MAYLGKQPVRGQNRELDDISGSFNGSNTAFTMQVGGVNTSAGSVNQIFISIGGVLQNPGTDFTVAASTLTLTTAPASGLDFWGLIQGDAVDINTPADSSVSTAKIIDNAVTGSKVAMGSDAQGDVLYYNGTDYARLGAGTSGHYLKTQGAGANPVWSATTVPNDNKNLIINGAMNVAQRGTSATTTGFNTLDRFQIGYGGHDEVLTTTQHTLTSSDTGPWELGFRKSYHVQNGNQTSGADAADYCQIIYKPEGQDINRSGWNFTDPNSKVTLSFWIKSSVAQNFYGFIEAGGPTRVFPYETGALTADTWKKVTVTIPGYATLAIPDTNAGAFSLAFLPFYGTGYTSASARAVGSWYDATPYCPNNTSTWWTTNDSTFEITGVQLEVGDTATDFQHEFYGDELFRCQRYCCIVGDKAVDVDIFSTVVFYGANDARVVVTFPRPMRASPSGTISSGTDFWVIMSAGSIMKPDSAAGVSTRPYHASVQFTDAVSGTSGNCGVIEPRETARMLFESEL
jgi:hypothetical protein